MFNFRELALDTLPPIYLWVERSEFLNFQLVSIFFCVIFFLFVIDGFLIYSIMLNDIEERTYEFAMLRTLGFENKSLAILLVV